MNGKVFKNVLNSIILFYYKYRKLDLVDLICRIISTKLFYMYYFNTINLNQLITKGLVHLPSERENGKNKNC